MRKIHWPGRSVEPPSGSATIGRSTDNDIVIADRRWQPHMGQAERARGVAAWHDGVDRTLHLAKKAPDDAGVLSPSAI